MSSAATPAAAAMSGADVEVLESRPMESRPLDDGRWTRSGNASGSARRFVKPRPDATPCTLDGWQMDSPAPAGQLDSVLIAKGAKDLLKQHYD